MRDNPLLRAIGAQFVLVMTHNHFLYIFFVLPDLPAGRSQRLISTYNICIAQVVTLIMFFGMDNSGGAKLLGIMSLSAMLAQIICVGITVGIKTICIKAFNSAMVKRTDMANLEKQLEKKEKLGEKQQWHLVLRQTASPSGSSDAARKKDEKAWRYDEPLML